MFTGIQVLRAKVRGLQAAGISIHNRIRKAKGPKRNKLWDDKRALGSFSREHLIAYGLMRGVPYDKIERCAKGNQPSAAVVFELMKAHADWKLARELTLEKVKELLTPSAEPAPRSNRLTRRAQKLLEKSA
jgi:hypothetical protein